MDKKQQQKKQSLHADMHKHIIRDQKIYMKRKFVRGEIFLLLFFIQFLYGQLLFIFFVISGVNPRGN